MACIADEKILAYCDDDLNAIEAARCRDHLLVCPACRLAADRYRSLEQSLSRPVFNDPPVTLLPRVMQRLYPNLPRFSSIIAAIAASLVFLITWIYVYFDFSSSSLIQALQLTTDSTSSWLVSTIKAISAIYASVQAAFKACQAFLAMLLNVHPGATMISAFVLAFAGLLLFAALRVLLKKTGANKE